MYPCTVKMRHIPCGKHAFTVDNYSPGCRVLSADTTKPDGTHPKPGETMVCPACGELIRSTTEFEVMP